MFFIVVGADPAKHGKTIEFDTHGNPIKKLTNYDIRQHARSILSDQHIITSALITRIQLIQMSCSKLLSSWDGMSSDFNEFRYIVERYAIFNDILNKTDEKLGKLTVGKFEEFLEVADICLNSMGTRFDWRGKLGNKFEEMKETDYNFNDHIDTYDLKSKSILNSIDRVNKSRIKGLRPFYAFCCEFVHPNIGDAISCMSDLEVRYAKDGSALRMRNSSHVSFPSDWNAELELLCRGYSFAEKILKDFIGRVPEAINLVKQTKMQSTKSIHVSVKTTNAFQLNDLCPCGNGMTVKNCRRRNKKKINRI